MGEGTNTLLVQTLVEALYDIGEVAPKHSLDCCSMLAIAKALASELRRAKVIAEGI
jgi:hypothetical protein